VLLVEDYPDLAEATAEFLAAEGFDVRIALSGHEALEIAPVFLPQLVLCDISLPDIPGLEVVRQVRSNPSTKETYVVVLTAFQETDLGSRSEIEEVRVDAFISKPLTLQAVRTLADKLTARPRS
jgi:CheY-like chemotaxis protein